MDGAAFNGLITRVGASVGRRSVLGLAAMAPLGIMVTEGAARKKRSHGGAGAEKKKKKKKGTLKTYCLNGGTVSSKNRKTQNAWLSQGATVGACSNGTCTPSCPAQGCGMSDGCGGTCGCGATGYCQNSVCVACEVTCTGTPAQCGNTLRAALANGGEIHACPGRYAGPFSITLGGNLFGAGTGDDPATSTILDGQGTTSPVIGIPDGGEPLSFAIQTLRVTGGGREGILAEGRGKLIIVGAVVAGNLGGGIRTTKELTMDYTQVTGNSISVATSSSLGGRQGAGIFIEDDRGFHHTIDHSLISSNTTDSVAGGIYVTDGDFEIARSTVTGNQGTTVGGINIGGSGGNFFVIDAKSNVTNNTATSGSPRAGGIVCDANTCRNRGATVSGNTNPQCGGTGGMTCS